MLILTASTLLSFSKWKCVSISLNRSCGYCLGLISLYVSIMPNPPWTSSIMDKEFDISPDVLCPNSTYLTPILPPRSFFFLCLILSSLPLIHSSIDITHVCTSLYSPSRHTHKDTGVQSSNYSSKRGRIILSDLLLLLKPSDTPSKS